MGKTKSSDKKGKLREKDKHQFPSRHSAGGGIVGRDSPKLLSRRPLITMRGPTLSSLEGEIELLQAWVKRCSAVSLFFALQVWGRGGSTKFLLSDVPQTFSLLPDLPQLQLIILQLSSNGGQDLSQPANISTTQSGHWEIFPQVRPPHHTPNWAHVTRWCLISGCESPQGGGFCHTPVLLRRRPSGFSSAASSFSSRGTSSSSRHRISSHASDFRSSGSGPGSDHPSLSQQGSCVSTHSGRSNLRTPCRDLLSTFSSQSSLPSPGQDPAGKQKVFGSTGSLQSTSGLRRSELFRSQPDGSSEESDQQSRRQAPANRQFGSQLRDQKQIQSASPVFTSQTIKDDGPTRRSPSPIKWVISPVKSKLLRKSSSSLKFRANSPPWETSQRSKSTSPLMVSGENYGGKLKTSPSHCSLRRNSTAGGQKKASNGNGTKKKLGFHFMGHSTNQ